MPKSILQFDPAGTLSPEDVLYLLQGTGLDRDRHVTLDVVRAWMYGGETSSITLAGDTTVDATLSGNEHSFILLLGTTVSTYTLTLMGTAPIPGQKTVIANFSLGDVTISGAVFNPGVPRILSGETATIEWTSGATGIVGVSSTESSVVPRFRTTVLERAAYVSDVAEIGPTGDIPIIRDNVLYKASAEDLRGQGYKIPQSGDTAMKLVDAEFAGSVTNGFNYTRGIIKCESVRSVGSPSKRWSITWNGEFGAEVVSSARFVKLQWAAPTTATSTAEKLAQYFHSIFVATEFAAFPVSFCFSRSDDRSQMAKVLSGFVRAGGWAGEVLWFFPLNSDGSQLTYAQLVTFLSGSGLYVRISAEGNS